MKLQIIKSISGKDEYVLLPIKIYRSLKREIDKEVIKLAKGDVDYVSFEVADYVDNPVALARVKACLTQKELAKRMGVTQAYISKLESQHEVSAKVLEQVNKALVGKK